MGGKYQNKKKFSPLRLLVLLLALGIFLFSGYQLWAYYAENRQSEQQQQALIDQAVVILPQETISGSENPEVPEQTSGEVSTEPTISLGDPPPIYVDFAALKAENEDIVAWIYCEDTLINYPIVQAEDNDYYLHRMHNGQYNSNGSIFMDFRNLSDFSDGNTLIYGHNMTNGAMFGTLKKYVNQEYYQEHPVMWILTPENAYRVDLIVGMVTPSDSDSYKFYNSPEELRTYLEEVLSKSTFDPGPVDLEGVGHIVTLSTCTYEYATARYIVIGNLVQVQYPQAPVVDAP